MSDLEWKTVTGNAISTIKCPCGFEVSGFDEAHNQWALEEHECSLVQHVAAPWYVYAFSFWGWAIIATVVVFIGTLIEEAMQR